MDPVELDYMEYANDAAAQAAFVTNAPSSNNIGVYATSGSWLAAGYTVFDSSPVTATVAGTLKSIDIKINGADSGAKVKIFRYEAPNMVLIGEQAVSLVSGENIGVPVNIPGVQVGDIIGIYLSTAQVLNLTYGGAASYYKSGDVGTSALSSWTANSNYEWCIAGCIGGVALQSYSESTIKVQGSYALKGIAAITDSLNKTLTRTISPVINLTDKTIIKFDIRASRTGSNIKIGIHDSGGTTTEITPNILAANSWQTVVWDLSGVSNANKDAIDTIIITIVNADADNTFYLDNVFGQIIENFLISRTRDRFRFRALSFG